VVLTMPILEGLDGVQKMSKSLNNYIGISEPPGEMFGKIMSISDDLMWRYFELLSFKETAQIDAMRAATEDGTENPRDVKFELAKEIVGRFHGKNAADAAMREFIARFQRGSMPDDMPEKIIWVENDELPIANLLKEASLTASTSESMRMIKQGAVKIDGERVEDSRLQIKADTENVYQVGKRKFAKVLLKRS
jgi:tyrosyl-tRNA synthetase